jgi:hypothetical protein
VSRDASFGSGASREPAASPPSRLAHLGRDLRSGSFKFAQVRLCAYVLCSYEAYVAPVTIDASDTCPNAQDNVSNLPSSFCSEEHVLVL